MREIKFRYTCKRDNGYTFSKVFSLEQIEAGDAKKWMEASFVGMFHLVKDEYIGFNDKNGKEIYEGDVVEVDPEWLECSDKGLIYWDEGRAALRISFPDGDIWDIREDIGYSEVIGNRHENPELLEVQK